MRSANLPFQVIFNLLIKWWWLILISVALGAGVGYFVRSKQPDVYSVTATVWFGQDVGSSSKQPINLGEIKNLITIYAGLARRDAVLQPVIDKLNLGISIDQLNGSLNLVDGLELPVLDVIVTHVNPEKAAEIAIATVTQFYRQHPDALKEIVFVCFDDENYALYTSLLN